MEGSLISRDASRGLKGLLILLIVLGHNTVLMTDSVTGEGSFVWSWLYSFHVSAFLILPFLYGPTPVSGQRLSRDSARLYVPYLWGFVLFATIYAIFTGTVQSAQLYVNTFIRPSDTLFQQTTGIKDLWFLPTMFALLCLKGLYDRGGRWIKGLLLSASGGLWIVLLIFGSTTRFRIACYCPFAISQAFYFLPIALAGTALVRLMKSSHRLGVALIWILFAALSIALYFRMREYSPVTTLLSFALPVVAFAALYTLANRLGQSRILRFLGDISLPIYLFHALIQFTLNRYVHSFWWGFATFTATVGLSVTVAVVIRYCGRLQHILFPRSWDDLRIRQRV